MPIDKRPPADATQARFCHTCGRPLVVDAGADLQACGYCTRNWDPGNPATYADIPPEPPEPPIWVSDRFARWSLLPLVLLGRFALNTVGATAASALNQTPTTEAAGAGTRIAGAVVAVGVLLLAVPWLFACGFLFLTALMDRVTLRFSAALPAAAAFNMVLLLGYPPAAWLAGVMLAPLVALVFVRVHG